MPGGQQAERDATHVGANRLVRAPQIAREAQLGAQQPLTDLRAQRARQAQRTQPRSQSDTTPERRDLAVLYCRPQSRQQSHREPFERLVHQPNQPQVSQPRRQSDKFHREWRLSIRFSSRRAQSGPKQSQEYSLQGVA